MKKNLIIVAIIVTIVLVFDQVLKIYIKSNFSPGETHPLIGDWFVLEYIENQGMAFGTTFGSSIWAKLALSLFRVAAIVGIVYYLIKQARTKIRLEFLIAVGLILAGATGNLIDSMFYDYLFPVDQYLNCHLEYNLLPGSGNYYNCDYYGITERTEIRHTGFLFGNVVDMFQFRATWPQWMPWISGKEVFPAIWNVADASITLGVVLVFFRQRTYFPKDKKQEKKRFALNVPWKKKTSNNIPPETEEQNASDTKQ